MQWLMELAIQALGLSFFTPFITQFLKREGWKGKKAPWLVWIVCCVTSAIVLGVRGQLPKFGSGSPAEITIGLLMFATAVCDMARKWYELAEPFFKLFGP